MRTLLKLIEKNLKLLIRSKSSALIIIIGPLLVIFLVGIAFDNLNQYSLNIGTYSESYSELANSFIAKLQEKEFKVQKIDSEELCINKIKQGKLHTCIIFPKDLTIEPGKMNEIVFHVDYSKINLIWMVLDTLSTKLKERSSELSMDLTSALLEKIETTKNEVYNKQPTIINLKTENQQAAEKIDRFRANVLDFKQTSDEMRSFFLTKIQGARNTVIEAKKKVNETNMSSSQASSINTRIASIDTYLLNMYNKIENPKGTYETDWSKITNLTTELAAQINSLKNLISMGSSKIDEVQASLDSIHTSLDSIEIKEAATIVSPIKTNIKPVVKEKTYLNYVFPSLIILVVMFISILLSTTLVMMEKHSPAYFRNFITPTKSITFILAIYLTNMILVITQLVIIIAISSYFFKSQIIQSLSITFPCLLLITTFFTFVGMAIGYFFTSEETATLASISIGSIFLFLSNVILPLESMPDYVRNIAQFNPFVLSESLLKKAIIFQSQFPDLIFELGLISIYSVVLFALIWAFQKAIRKHFFYRLTIHKQKNEKMRKKR